MTSALASCSSFERDDLMEELNSSYKADQLRMNELGLAEESGPQLQLIDPTDRFLLQEDFDCKKTQIAMAYCQN
jgi:hypothetical protein